VIAKGFYLLLYSIAPGSLSISSLKNMTLARWAFQGPLLLSCCFCYSTFVCVFQTPSITEYRL